jgi:hypothetical protein
MYLCQKPVKITLEKSDSFGQITDIIDATLQIVQVMLQKITAQGTK